MKINKVIIWLAIFFTKSTILIGQADYSVAAIADSLQKNSNAVVRLESTEFTFHNIKSATEKIIYVVTVLNKQGEDFADFICYGDKFRSLKSFSGAIYDKDGKQTRKIKKSEVKESEYFQGLASDAMYYELTPQTSHYPYTVRYEYELAWKNGIISFPSFVPVPTYNVAVEQANYKLVIPKDTKYSTKSVNTKIKPTHKSVDKFDVYEWTVQNVAAIKSEQFAPARFDVFPRIYLTPNDFSYDNVAGNQSDWTNYGKWQWSLLQNRDVLPEALKQEVHKLTDGKSPREKIKTLYEYLGKTTRYVSIQLGIGGLQPMTVDEVYKTKFGDCKALSNYLKAMLKECGIESHYTELSTRNKTIFKDYASVVQTNHVILQVPIDGDTLWLECTNPEIPFGYVHDNIAGHDALVYKDGSLYHTTIPASIDSLNLMTQKVVVNIEDDGRAKINATKRMYSEQYERVSSITKIEEKDRINFVRSLVKLPIAEVKNVSINENKSSDPVIEIAFDVDAQKYGTVSGSRYFIPTNPFNTNARKIELERKLDIAINYGYKDVDTIVLNFPENLIVETMPKLQKIDSEFGSCSQNIQVEKGKITIIQQFYFRRGKYPKEHVSKLSDFMKAVDKMYNTKLVLKKNNL